MTAISFEYEELADRIAELPTHCTWRDVLRIVADDDLDRFVDLWISNRLPEGVMRRCLDHADLSALTVLLLRRLCRLDEDAQRLSAQRQQVAQAVLALHDYVNDDR